MAEAHVHLQYESFESQTHAARLGMWLFLVSEILLFAGLFVLYASYRAAHPQVFAQAVGHAKIFLGTAMTFLLVTSSLTATLAVDAVREDRARRALGWLGATVGLGVIFLALKGTEWAMHLGEGARPGIYYAFEKLPVAGGNAFYTLYYMTTGLHALHLAGGILFLAGMVWAVRRGRVHARYPTPLELGSLYWHLVDVIWMFLFPMFYLMRWGA